MTILDVGVIVCVTGLGLIGYLRGFVREVISSVGAIAAALLAFRELPTASKLLGVSSPHAWWVDPAIVVGLFVLIMTLFSIGGLLIRQFLRKINLGFYERLVGFVMGGAKGSVIAAVATLCLFQFGSQSVVNTASRSQYARANLMALSFLHGLLPDYVAGDSSIVGPFISNDVSRFQLARVLIQCADSPGGMVFEELTGKLTDWQPESQTGEIEFRLGQVPYRLPVEAWGDGRLPPQSNCRLGDSVAVRLLYLPGDRRVIAAIQSIAVGTDAVKSQE